MPPPIQATPALQPSLRNLGVFRRAGRAQLQLPAAVGEVVPATPGQFGAGEVGGASRAALGIGVEVPLGELADMAAMILVDRDVDGVERVVVGLQDVGVVRLEARRRP